MTEQQTIEATTFGRVLREFMERRGFDAIPENVVALGDMSGLDGEELLLNAKRDLGDGRRRQNFTRLAEALHLGESEKARLAVAYLFEHDPRR